MHWLLPLAAPPESGRWQLPLLKPLLQLLSGQRLLLLQLPHSLCSRPTQHTGRHVVVNDLALFSTKQVKRIVTQAIPAQAGLLIKAVSFHGQL